MSLKYSSPSSARPIWAEGPITYSLGTMGRSTAAKSRASSSSGSGARVRSSGRAASPSESPRSIVGDYDLSSLSGTWDNSEQLRKRVRNGLTLLLRLDQNGEPEKGFVEATVENLKLNADVLSPVFRLMKENSQKLPQVDRLIESISKFYDTAKVFKGGDVYYQEAWAIRRLIGKMKTFTYRETPPEDCGFQIWRSYNEMSFSCFVTMGHQVERDNLDLISFQRKAFANSSSPHLELPTHRS